MSCGSPFAIRMPPYVRTANHNAEPPIAKPHIYLDKAFLLVHLSRPALLANFADTDGVWPYHIVAQQLLHRSHGPNHCTYALILVAFPHR